MIVAMLVLACSVTASAPSRLLYATEGATAPPATIDDVAWIAGHWTCEALGGIAEELWLPPSGGAMLATFRMIRDDKPSFYEIATISEANGSLVCRILHFDQALHGWEKEKNGPQQFPLVKLEGKTAWFSGLTFEKKDDGAMDVYVAVHAKDGTVSEAKFPYRAAAVDASTR
jgi:hypothetical protein